ncbi:MAG TPA: hypothetical protein ENM98_05435 [Halothiobacillaceae bacterium]|nr:hypothetical protein [Halothiobacillaceae bacterium]
MFKAFIKGFGDHLYNARITFDKFHVIAQASRAVDLTRRAEHRQNGDLPAGRQTLLPDSQSACPCSTHWKFNRDFFV